MSWRLTFPVINAWALIKAQSSNLGFKWAISGFCKKASLSNGLNKPDCFKLFSTIFEISKPISLISNSLFNFLLSSSLENNDATATGSGLRFPLVMSTLIKAVAFKGKKIKKNINNFFTH